MSKNVKKLFCLALVLILFAACGSPGGHPPIPPENTDGSGESGPAGDDPAAPAITTDREGFPVVLPEQIDTIVSIGPSNTEVLVALGFGENIIATDTFSEGIEGIAPGISVFEMLSVDVERLIDLQPDVVFITGMSRLGGEDDPLSMVTQVGIAVIYMPSSASIAEIQEDIRFIAAVVGKSAEGESIIAQMQTELDRISAVAQNITERRTVYFEISPAPHLVSFGTGTFLHEMIELMGAENVFADRQSWFSMTDEVIIEINPDVILTSVNFIEDPVGDIIGRPGWSAITAVQNGDVFIIGTDASNRPTHNIVIALREMAAAVYPEYFG